MFRLVVLPCLDLCMSNSSQVRMMQFALKDGSPYVRATHIAGNIHRGANFRENAVNLIFPFLIFVSARITIDHTGSKFSSSYFCEISTGAEITKNCTIRKFPMYGIIYL